MVKKRKSDCECQCCCCREVERWDTKLKVYGIIGGADYRFEKERLNDVADFLFSHPTMGQLRLTLTEGEVAHMAAMFNSLVKRYETAS